MAGQKYLNKLRGSHVLIIGGTGTFGSAISEALIEYGARIVLVGSRPENLASAVERLNREYPDTQDDITTVLCDLGEAAKLESRLFDLFKKVSSNGEDQIDHIVYVAGDKLDVGSGITDTDIARIESLMTVRVYGPALVGKIIASTNYVRKSYQTSFTFTAGSAHVRPRKTWPVISMLAGALQGLATGLAVEVAPVRVNVVNPGIFETEVTQKLPAQVRAGLENGNLNKRFGRAEDIAEAYLYFMKDHSVDGVAITSDNGKLLA